MNPSILSALTQGKLSHITMSRLFRIYRRQLEDAQPERQGYVNTENKFTKIRAKPSFAIPVKYSQRRLRQSFCKETAIVENVKKDDEDYISSLKKKVPQSFCFTEDKPSEFLNLIEKAETNNLTMDSDKKILKRRVVKTRVNKIPEILKI